MKQEHDFTEFQVLKNVRLLKWLVVLCAMFLVGAFAAVICRVFVLQDPILDLRATTVTTVCIVALCMLRLLLGGVLSCPHCGKYAGMMTVLKTRGVDLTCPHCGKQF